MEESLDGPLDKDAIIERLQRQGWLDEIWWFDQLDSTNDWIKRLSREDRIPKGIHLVVADRQTAGRGRGDHRWWSPAGCLTFTLAWEGTSDLPPEQIPQLALVVGQAIAEALEHFSSQPCMIKWPNDVMIESKKVAGVLIESIDRARWAIGIGINVAVDLAEADTEVQRRATSLHRWCSVKVRREDVLWEVCQAIENGLATWLEQPELLAEKWRSRCWLTGKAVTVSWPNEREVGVVLGIDSIGQLILQTASGKPRSVLSGSVELL